VLRPGANDVTLSITTTLVGLFEGRRYDPRRREAVPLAAPDRYIAEEEEQP
jgi:hypothetical protein